MYDKLSAVVLVAVVVLSGSAFALATGVHEDVTGSQVDSQANDPPNMVLVFGDDYTPGLRFRVLNRLKQGVVRNVLGQPVDGGPVIEDTSQYSGYLVQFLPTSGDSGQYGLVFTDVDDGQLMVGDQYQFSSNVTYFRTEINLLQPEIRSVEAETTPAEGTATTAGDGMATTNETVTPTPEGGEAMTNETGTPTPTTEAGVVGANETTAPAETTATEVVEETTTAEPTEGGLVSSIVDFINGLFGGGGDNEGAEVTTTVEGG